jgi:glycosyltransferase involved in cell wall biosynthesis
MTEHMNNALVSIIIPSYNMAAQAVRAVESVLAQTYPNIEIIFVDDGSTDDTRQRLEPYKSKITYLYKNNGGVCSARNLGLRQAKGRYIGLLDSDDTYMPDKVEACMDFFKRHPDYGFVHTDTYLVDGQGAVVSRYNHPMSRYTGWVTRHLLMGNFIANPTCFLKRECVEQCGVYNEKLFPPADWDVWLRISRKYKVGYIDRPLSKYSIVSNSCFNDLERTQREEKIVLDGFFSEEHSFDGWVKNKAYSAYHVRMAQCYFIKRDMPRYHEEFKMACQSFPLNLRCWGFGLLSMVAPAYLNSKLRKRIIRSELCGIKAK